MTYDRYVEIGRVIFIPSGPSGGKLAVIVEVIDQNRALVDGPSTGVPRQAVSFKDMHLTKFVLPVRQGARTATVQKAWKASTIGKDWDASTWAKKLKMRELRAKLSDFDRFKLMKAKQARNRILKSEFKKAKKTQAKKPTAKKTKKPAPKAAKGKPAAKK